MRVLDSVAADRPESIRGSSDADTLSSGPMAVLRRVDFFETRRMAKAHSLPHESCVGCP